MHCWLFSLLRVCLMYDGYKPGAQKQNETHVTCTILASDLMLMLDLARLEY